MVVERAFIGMGAIEAIGRTKLTIIGFGAGAVVGGLFAWFTSRNPVITLAAGGVTGSAVAAGTYLYATGGMLVTERLKR